MRNFVCVSLLVLLTWTASPADVLRAPGGGSLDLYGVHLAVGDVVAIDVNDTISASNVHDLEDQQKSKLDNTPTNRGILGIFGGLIPAASGGTSNNSKNNHEMKLKMQLSARIVSINGHTMELEGRRETGLNGQKMTVVMKATGRLADVNSDNTVPSTRLTNVTLRIDGLPKKKSDDLLRRFFNMIL